MFLSLHHDMAQWTRQDWVDFWDMVGNMSQVAIVVLTVVTAIVAVYQLRMRRIEARPQIDMHIEREDHSLRISLVNVKSIPVFIKKYAFSWLIPLGFFRKKETIFPWIIGNTVGIREEPREKKVLNTGETFELIIRDHFFSFFIGCMQGLIKLTEEEERAMKLLIDVNPFLNHELVSSQQSYELMILFDVPGVIPRPRVFIYLERLRDDGYLVYAEKERFVYHKGSLLKRFVNYNHKRSLLPVVKDEIVIPRYRLDYQDILDYCKAINKRRITEWEIYRMSQSVLENIED